MVESASRTSGTQALRPRARILRTFGDELISSETVAVIELVKNAYDADATRVLVRFQESLEIGQGRIEVMDNGHGMSLETIQTTWMESATLSRKRQQRSEQYGRRVLGEKGIGRFAASRLANTLKVVTRRTGKDREIRALFDWSQFDDEQKYLDQVEVLWEESTPAEICPGGTIQILWGEGQTPESNALTHGTILRMEGLRALWEALHQKSELSPDCGARWVSALKVSREKTAYLSRIFAKLLGIYEVAPSQKKSVSSTCAGDHGHTSGNMAKGEPVSSLASSRASA